VIAAGLAASGMWPWGNLARAPTPLYKLLDKRAADARQCREGSLRAPVCVIGTKDFLAQIEGIGLHGDHTNPWLPFTQLQTALAVRELTDPDNTPGQSVPVHER
jgi:hypothetical protein